MKKIIAMFLLLTTLVLAGCTGDKDPVISDPIDEISEFYGTVLENHGVSILVEPDADSWVRNSSDKVSVSIANAELLNFAGEKITAAEINVGAKVKISFTGGIAESYPAQIHGCFEVRLV